MSRAATGPALEGIRTGQDLGGRTEWALGIALFVMTKRSRIWAYSHDGLVSFLNRNLSAVGREKIRDYELFALECTRCKV